MFAVLLAGPALGAGHARHLRTGETIAVIDGDTVEIDGVARDLSGIDAPELSQTCLLDGGTWHCGTAAAFALKKIIDLDAAMMTCAPPKNATTGNGVSPDDGAVVCEVGEKDLGVRLLRDGYVVAVAPVTPGYAAAEAAARDAGLGLWRGRFVPPSGWRAGRRLAYETPAPCVIKGIADGADGARVYYGPTDDGYDAVTSDPARGDRRFCSDEDARAAGWTHAGAS